MAKVITDIETYNLSKTGEQIDSLLDEIGTKVTQIEINTAINNLRTAIDKELTALKNGAPEAMDSLGEIANTLQNNPKVIEEVRNAITKESEDRASALTAERNAWRQAVTSEENARNTALQQEREGREAADRDINADIENLKKADAAINDKITDLVSGGVPDESIGAEKIEGVEFNEATKRENIATGETLKTLFGKIKKWFSDLKPIAWSGSYNDLTDTESIALSGIPTAPTAAEGTDNMQIATTEFVNNALLAKLGIIEEITMTFQKSEQKPQQTQIDEYFTTTKYGGFQENVYYRVKVTNASQLAQHYDESAGSVYGMRIDDIVVINDSIGDIMGMGMAERITKLNSGEYYLTFDGEYITVNRPTGAILPRLAALEAAAFGNK